MKPKIVVIGGGTGSYTVLQGLKHYDYELTAVVSIVDDGGSSGRLRDEFGHLPPGDFRKCLLALSPSDQEGELLRRLLEYRFDHGDGLSGHNFGNLLITAMTEITGNPLETIKAVSKLLNIDGKVLPVSTEDTRLVAVLEDGTIVHGETNVDIRTVNPDVAISSVYLDPPAHVHPETQQAILDADFIVLAPGDLYSSILPNLLVKGVPEAIERSRAEIIHVCNLMTKHGETDNFRASDFLSELTRALGSNTNIDYCLVDNTEYDNQLLKTYMEELSYPVLVDLDRSSNFAKEIRVSRLSSAGNLIRHDPTLLASEISQFVQVTGNKND